MNRLCGVLAVVCLLAASSADAACVLNVRLTGGGSSGQPLALAWDAVSGAVNYEVTESRDESATSTNTRIFSPGFIIRRRASVDTKINYRVVAILGAGVMSSKADSSGDACFEEIIVTIAADPAFRKMTRRAIVPIAGSTEGALGARFRTGVEMTASGRHQGKVVFRPAGTAPSGNDRSVPYEFEGAGLRMSWDDIVASMGASGIGSLEIIPDEASDGVIPSTRVHLYQQDEQGTFGSFTAPVYPFDFLQPVPLSIFVPARGFRVNAGVRTIKAVALKALIYDINGRLRALRDLEFPAEFTSMKSLDDFVGTRVLPGERVVLLPSDAVISFYTLTENGTNDPSLFIATPFAASGDVGKYVY